MKVLFQILVVTIVLNSLLILECLGQENSIYYYRGSILKYNTIKSNIEKRTQYFKILRRNDSLFFIDSVIAYPTHNEVRSNKEFIGKYIVSSTGSSLIKPNADSSHLTSEYLIYSLTDSLYIYNLYSTVLFWNGNINYLKDTLFNGEECFKFEIKQEKRLAQDSPRYRGYTIVSKSSWMPKFYRIEYLKGSRFRVIESELLMYKQE